MLSRRQLLRRAPALALGGAALAATPFAGRPALADGECSTYDQQGLRYCTVGLRIGEIETVRQRCEYWCWAACIQAVFALHGRDVAQEEIVRRVYGAEVCTTADAGAILYAIQGDWIDAYGRPFRAYAQALPDLTTRLMVGAGAGDILNELYGNNPLINGAVGHATVLTAATYAEDRWGNQQIVEFVVRDPWPSSPNRRVLQVQELYGASFLAKVVVA